MTDFDSFLEKLNLLEKMTLGKIAELQQQADQYQELLETKRAESDKLDKLTAKTLRLQQEIANMRVEHLDLKAQLDVVDELPRLIIQKEDAEDKLAEQTRKAEQSVRLQQRMFGQHEQHLRELEEYYRSKPKAHRIKQIEEEIRQFDLNGKTAAILQERQTLTAQLRDAKQQDKELASTVATLSSERDELRRKLRDAQQNVATLARRQAEMKAQEKAEIVRLEQELQIVQNRKREAQRRERDLEANIDRERRALASAQEQSRRQADAFSSSIPGSRASASASASAATAASRKRAREQPSAPFADSKRVFPSSSSSSSSSSGAGAGGPIANEFARASSVPFSPTAQPYTPGSQRRGANSQPTAALAASSSQNGRSASSRSAGSGRGNSHAQSSNSGRVKMSLPIAAEDLDAPLHAQSSASPSNSSSNSAAREAAMFWD